MPYSGYTYICALPNASLEQVVKALNLCLEYFGGVPFSVKSDNLKQVVTKPSLYEPSFTQTMDQWSVHNRTILVAARVRKLKNKPHVEGGVQLAYLRVYAPLRDHVVVGKQQCRVFGNRECREIGNTSTGWKP